jgi:hypothetical protein
MGDTIIVPKGPRIEVVDQRLVILPTRVWNALLDARGRCHVSDIIQTRTGDGWQTPTGAEVAAILDRQRHAIDQAYRDTLSDPHVVLIVAPLDVIDRLFTGEGSLRTTAEARASGHAEMVVSAKMGALWSALMQLRAVAAAKRLTEMFAGEAFGRVVLVATSSAFALMSVRGHAVDVDNPAHTIGKGGDA